ncbi:hypothetical protein FQA39_LY04363 [Lamprigera yunnana]|nr:hypothetical protein FQA39_LY04363 [Lamprigera yunnana]
MEVENETSIQIIQRYKHIVENKITNGASIAKKSKAWEAITKNLNASVSSGNRNRTQIKNMPIQKYEKEM